jgi:LemA protein
VVGAIQYYPRHESKPTVVAAAIRPWEIVMWIGVLLVVIAVIVAGWLIAVYNRLVALKNRVANAYAQIDVQLKRRHDLIPNLLEVARKYMAHERETFEAIVAARNRAIAAQGAAARDPTDPNAIASLTAAETALGGALGRLYALTENYPELKASTTMAQFSEELTSTENKVAFARQAFNDAVMALNTAIQAFPAVLFAGSLGFKSAGMLEAVEAPTERAAPVVKF